MAIMNSINETPGGFWLKYPYRVMIHKIPMSGGHKELTRIRAKGNYFESNRDFRNADTTKF